MRIDDKIKRLYRSLQRARRSGNFRRIHKWEHVLERARRRQCPWNPLSKNESLYKLKARIDALKFLGLTRVEDYKWDWCGTCRCAFVRCPNCGNNSCNSTVGKFRKDGSKPDNTDNWEDLVDCPVCNIAHDIEQFAVRTGTIPPRSSFPHADDEERKSDEAWSNSFLWLDEKEEQWAAEEQAPTPTT